MSKWASPSSALKPTVSLPPRKTTAPCRVSSSLAGRFSRVVASAINCARAVAAAWRICTPPAMIPVLPPVDSWSGVKAVSLSISVISSGETPSSSETICRIAVRAGAEIDLPSKHRHPTVPSNREVDIDAVTSDGLAARPRPHEAAKMQRQHQRRQATVNVERDASSLSPPPRHAAPPQARAHDCHSDKDSAPTSPAPRPRSYAARVPTTQLWS